MGFPTYQRMAQWFRAAAGRFPDFECRTASDVWIAPSRTVVIHAGHAPWVAKRVPCTKGIQQSRMRHYRAKRHGVGAHVASMVGDDDRNILVRGRIWKAGDVGVTRVPGKKHLAAAAGRLFGKGQREAAVIATFAVAKFEINLPVPFRGKAFGNQQQFSGGSDSGH